MDEIMLSYSISMAIAMNLDMQLMDTMITYLYGSLDDDIYMKISYGFKIPKKGEN